MSIPVDDKDRRVIPRWRQSSVTATTGELSRPRTPAPFSDEELASFDEKQRAWRGERDIGSAAELVAVAFVLGREREAIEAAHFLANPESSATPDVRRIARRVLARVGVAEVLPDSEAEDPADLRQVIRSAKRRLRDEPRNAIQWVDLSRVYAILGQSRSAAHAMNIAVKQTEANRFVLRSAARLLVHLNDAEQAHDILRRREATRHDPWLMSAEIAVASTAQRTSSNLKRAQQTLSSGRFGAFDKTELASALATVELANGNQRAARKLLRQSLERPTENSVAQAAWVARRMPSFQVATELLSTPRTFEARAWQGFKAADWEASVNEARAWLLDEPFSSRPAQFGSFVASVGLEDFDAAIHFAEEGLRANPNDMPLLNNLAFALAEQGNLPRAIATLSAAKSVSAGDDEDIFLTATEGLIQYRMGNGDAGYALYQSAIERATAKGMRRAKAFALAHLLREEIRFHKADVPQPLITAVEDLIKSSDPDLRAFLSRIEPIKVKLLASTKLVF